MAEGAAAAATRWSAASAAVLPAPVSFTAPAGWKTIDFISDLHLSEALPSTFEAFAAHLRYANADAIFILGDFFELWVGDDARHEPFAARCVKVLAEAASRQCVGVMCGNRDFLMGQALLDDCGAQALADPTLLHAFGRKVLLTHGDALCVADIAYQDFRRRVRAPEWLQPFLAQPLEERLAFARQIRRASDVRRQFDGEGAADVDASLARQMLRECGATTLVHGHTHRPGSESWPAGLARHVLSDWDLDGGHRAEVLRLTVAGFERMAPSRI